MALTPINAAVLTQDPAAKWLIEEFPYPMSIAKIFPFKGIDGGEIRVGGVPAQTPAPTLSSGQTITSIDQTQTPSGTNHYIGYFYTRYEIEYQAQDGFKFPTDQDEAQKLLAIRRLLYAFFRNLENGTAAYPIPPGIPGLLNSHAGQIVTAATPGTFLLSEFYEAYHLVSANDGRPNAIMSTQAAQRDFIMACVNAGINLEYTDFTWDDPIKGRVTAPILSVLGTPWFINGALTEDDNIFFMVLGFDGQATSGRGLTGIIPRQLQGNMFVRRKLPVVTELTTGAPPVVDMYSKESISYSWPVGIAVGSPGALSIYTGF